MNVKIVYKNGQGHINAQDLQIQCLLEFEKLKIKFASLKRRGVNTGALSTNGTNVTQAHFKEDIKTNKTFLPIDSILYPKNTQKAVELDKKGGKRRGLNTNAMLGVTGLQGYAAAGR